MLVVSLAVSVSKRVVWTAASHGDAEKDVYFTFSVVYRSLFYAILPVTVLVINAVVLREVRRASQYAAVNLGLQQHQQSTSSSNSAVPTAMLVTTSLVYVLLGGTAFIYDVYLWYFHITDQAGGGQGVAGQVLVVLWETHHFIYAYNFYVYLVTGKQFRCQLRRLFCCPGSAAAEAANDDAAAVPRRTRQTHSSL